MSSVQPYRLARPQMIFHKRMRLKSAASLPMPDSAFCENRCRLFPWKRPGIRVFPEEKAMFPPYPAFLPLYFIREIWKICV
jgi:hypothetical protein